ncbi:OadG family protein [uncultured Halopseudomonas sp.]|jgi:oxaloacetate decarboxylase gamma subunit|uniref:OadG family protein n=1 Tax=uncultured Halopseudomonas sp. TaxID=2901193 RepID=UPI0030EEB53E|tara:strand:- start:18515 stop:18769 length:255 start_codon:yes stop_codon:yes gene_type:complete
MNSSELVTEGLELMVLGMGSVFIFLILLVAVTTAMSAILTRYFPEALPVAKAPKRVRPTAGAAVDPEVVAVIGAAIKQHRSRRG